MHIQLNSDNQVLGSPELQARVERALSRELKHLAGLVTRIEVHLNDENSIKGGAHDKRCQLEARVSGRLPISVEHRAATIDLALNGAAEQLARALTSIQGRQETGSRRRASIRHGERS